MSVLKPLTIELASGHRLVLSDSFEKLPQLTGSARLDLRWRPAGSAGSDVICTVFVFPWDTYSVPSNAAGGDTRTLCCGHTHLDLDSAEQARAARDWLDAYFAAYNAQRAAAQQVAA